jgi:hypothetical protein
MAVAAPRWRVDSTASAIAGCSFQDVTRVPGTRILWAVGFCNDGSPITDRHTPRLGWRQHAASSGNLESVTALTAGDVWAVGTNDGLPLAVHWDGKSWSEVATASLAPGTEGAELTSVTAISSDDVWAVGWRDVPIAHQRTLVEHWDGSSWHVVPSPNLSTRLNELLNIVPVPGHPDRQWAVGWQLTRHHATRPLVLRRRGTKWTVIRSLPRVASGLLYGGVATGTPGGLWLVGVRYRRLGGAEPLVYRRSRRGWGLVQATPRGAHSADFQAAAVIPGTASLWAVGAGPLGGLVERWDGTTWDLVPSPADVGTLAAVTASRRNAWAVGGSAFGTLVEHYN